MHRICKGISNLSRTYCYYWRNIITEYNALWYKVRCSCSCCCYRWNLLNRMPECIYTCWRYLHRNNTDKLCHEWRYRIVHLSSIIAEAIVSNKNFDNEVATTSLYIGLSWISINFLALDAKQPNFNLSIDRKVKY
jgi:hypothetical protein